MKKTKSKDERYEVPSTFKEIFERLEKLERFVDALCMVESGWKEGERERFRRSQNLIWTRARKLHLQAELKELEEREKEEGIKGDGER